MFAEFSPSLSRVQMASLAIAHFPSLIPKDHNFTSYHYTWVWQRSLLFRIFIPRLV